MKDKDINRLTDEELEELAEEIADDYMRAVELVNFVDKLAVMFFTFMITLTIVDMLLADLSGYNGNIILLVIYAIGLYYFMTRRRYYT